MQTIVIGHKNPDMDSICAPIAYARLRQLLGETNIVAARAGNTNERINFALQKFSVKAPMLLTDVSPRVSDVMEKSCSSLQAQTPIYDAIQLLEKSRSRALPIVDKDQRCLGLLLASDVSHYLFPPRENMEESHIIHASLTEIIRIIKGTILSAIPDHDPGEYSIVVGATDFAAFAKKPTNRQSRSAILFMSHCEPIDFSKAGECLSAIVVGGGQKVGPSLDVGAKKAGVALISTPYDAATSILLARGSTRVDRLLNPDFISFSPDTLLSEAREKAAASETSVFPILENDRLVGILSKSDFLKTIQRQLILIDHNELSQAVDGADTISIVGILDHHRIGGFSSELPILFWNDPVGSSSTIVALCYQQSGVEIPPNIAGLLMAGLISDTLNLTSPTSTPVDRQILATLSSIAKVNPAELADEIFSVGSPLLTMKPEQAITADCKEFNAHGVRFSVAQIEELSFSHFDDKYAALAEALHGYCKQHGYLFSALLVTDINTQNSLLLVSGSKKFKSKIDFPEYRESVWDLKGIVSRKKQLLPYLTHCLTQMGNGKS